MPTFTTTRTYQDNSGLNQAMLDAAFNSVETFINTTKLGSDNLQTNAVATTNIAPGAVTASQLAALAVTLASLNTDVTAQLVPSGVLNPFAGASAPTGWLLCDGTAVSRTTYAALFGAIGTTWGTGDGSTTFNLPNLAGRTLIGSGTGSGLTARTLGQTVGEETHVLSTGEMPAHNHFTPNGFGTNVSNWQGAPLGGTFGGGGNGAYYATDGSGPLTDTKGSSAAHNNMQPSAVVTFIIKT